MYIDPNTGGMLFGMLAAAFAGVSALLMAFSGKIRGTIARWRRGMREKDQTEETAADESQK
jgi:hypothetical protein